jgi:hypothetical protein
MTLAAVSLLRGLCRDSEFMADVRPRDALGTVRGDRVGDSSVNPESGVSKVEERPGCLLGVFDGEFCGFERSHVSMILDTTASRQDFLMVGENPT